MAETVCPTPQIYEICEICVRMSGWLAAALAISGGRWISFQAVLIRFHWRAVALCGTKAVNWVGKNVFLAFLQPVENCRGGGLGRGLRYLEAAVHIGINRPQDHRVDRHSLTGEQRSVTASG